jgi:hypothetical protein
MCEPEEMTEELNELDREGQVDAVAAVVHFGEALAGQVCEVFPRWVAHIVAERFGSEVSSDIGEVGRNAQDALRDPLLRFFRLDIDEQRTTPLSIIRAHMNVVTQWLRDQGMQPVERDEFDTRSNPDDVFALGPFAWIDFGEDVHVAGLQWGAAKAFVHRQRHRPSSPGGS